MKTLTGIAVVESCANLKGFFRMDDAWVVSFDIAIKKAEVLVEALPYIRKFHGDTIVITLGGSSPDAAQENVGEDIVPLRYVGRTPVGVRGRGAGAPADPGSWGRGRTRPVSLPTCIRLSKPGHRPVRSRAHERTMGHRPH